MKIQGIAIAVEKYLKNHPHLRDSDERLIGCIWNDEVEAQGSTLVNTTAKGLISLLIEKKISKPESITRARRKLQEEFPHLRGKTYKVRQEDQQEETKHEVKTFGDHYRQSDLFQQK